MSNAPECPKCNKNDEVLPIVYGYPGPEMMKKSNEGKCVLGGCVIGNDSPNYQCKRCK